MNQIFHHWSKVATDSTSWDYPVCTRDTLWRQHYIRTNKEYLINFHISLQYFELVFLQLQLVQILCKLIIIWVNYEKTKRGPFLWNSVYFTSLYVLSTTIVLIFFCFIWLNVIIRLEDDWEDVCFSVAVLCFYLILGSYVSNASLRNNGRSNELKPQS